MSQALLTDPPLTGIHKRTRRPVRKKSHIALAVSNISTSAYEYSQRLGQPPGLITPDHYALWPPTTSNLLIRTTSTEVDCNERSWECFAVQQQVEKIIQARPNISSRTTFCSS